MTMKTSSETEQRNLRITPLRSQGAAAQQHKIAGTSRASNGTSIQRTTQVAGKPAPSLKRPHPLLCLADSSAGGPMAAVTAAAAAQQNTQVVSNGAKQTVPGSKRTRRSTLQNTQCNPAVCQPGNACPAAAAAPASGEQQPHSSASAALLPKTTVNAADIAAAVGAAAAITAAATRQRTVARAAPTRSTQIHACCSNGPAAAVAAVPVPGHQSDPEQCFRLCVRHTILALQAADRNPTQLKSKSELLCDCALPSNLVFELQPSQQQEPLVTTCFEVSCQQPEQQQPGQALQVQVLKCMSCLTVCADWPEAGRHAQQHGGQLSRNLADSMLIRACGSRSLQDFWQAVVAAFPCHPATVDTATKEAAAAKLQQLQQYAVQAAEAAGLAVCSLDCGPVLGRGLLQPGTLLDLVTCKLGAYSQRPDTRARFEVQAATAGSSASIVKQQCGHVLQCVQCGEVCHTWRAADEHAAGKSRRPTKKPTSRLKIVGTGGVTVAAFIDSLKQAGAGSHQGHTSQDTAHPGVAPAEVRRKRSEQNEWAAHGTGERQTPAAAATAATRVPAALGHAGLEAWSPADCRLDNQQRRQLQQQGGVYKPLEHQGHADPLTAAAATTRTFSRRQGKPQDQQQSQGRRGMSLVHAHHCVSVSAAVNASVAMAYQHVAAPLLANTAGAVHDLSAGERQQQSGNRSGRASAEDDSGIVGQELAGNLQQHYSFEAAEAEELPAACMLQQQQELYAAAAELPLQPGELADSPATENVSLQQQVDIASRANKQGQQQLPAAAYGGGNPAGPAATSMIAAGESLGQQHNATQGQCPELSGCSQHHPQQQQQQDQTSTLSFEQQPLRSPAVSALHQLVDQLPGPTWQQLWQWLTADSAEHQQLAKNVLWFWYDTAAAGSAPSALPHAEASARAWDWPALRMHGVCDAVTQLYQAAAASSAQDRDVLLGVCTDLVKAACTTDSAAVQGASRAAEPEYVKQQLTELAAQTLSLTIQHLTDSSSTYGFGHCSARDCFVQLAMTSGIEVLQHLVSMSSNSSGSAAVAYQRAVTHVSAAALMCRLIQQLMGKLTAATWRGLWRLLMPEQSPEAWQRWQRHHGAEASWLQPMNRLLQILAGAPTAGQLLLDWGVQAAKLHLIPSAIWQGPASNPQRNKPPGRQQQLRHVLFDIYQSEWWLQRYRDGQHSHQQPTQQPTQHQTQPAVQQLRLLPSAEAASQALLPPERRSSRQQVQELQAPVSIPQAIKFAAEELLPRFHDFNITACEWLQANQQQCQQARELWLQHLLEHVGMLVQHVALALMKASTYGARWFPLDVDSVLQLTHGCLLDAISVFSELDTVAEQTAAITATGQHVLVPTAAGVLGCAGLTACGCTAHCTIRLCSQLLSGTI